MNLKAFLSKAKRRYDNYRESKRAIKLKDKQEILFDLMRKSNKRIVVLASDCVGGAAYERLYAAMLYTNSKYLVSTGGFFENLRKSGLLFFAGVGRFRN